MEGVRSADPLSPGGFQWAWKPLWTPGTIKFQIIQNKSLHFIQAISDACLKNLSSDSEFTSTPVKNEIYNIKQCLKYSVWIKRFKC